MGAKIDPEPHSPSQGNPSKAPHLHLVSAASPPVQKLPNKRPLNDSELLAARKVFASAIQYPLVRIEKMGSFTELINGSRAYTLANSINLPGKAYANPSQYTSIIIHELVHVWQYQHGGWGYVPNALWAQTLGDGYDFAKALRQGKSWAQMNPEQQAQMIQEAFRSAYFENPGARFGVLANKGSVVRASSQTPDGFVDYTSALVDALAVLRKGT
ncbi:hypothetical protein [Hyalangium versicolor]|uniref:hypothetical protein n=1 Tax=Hyalangium versicolor TaxID=2861190 RepID=UPI001CCCCDB1|nr:hypothetical protein [Hyalangium versicolor]